MIKTRVAIQQHFLSHYREPIFNLLCRQKYPDPEYVIFADITNKAQIKTIDFAKFSIDPASGGVRWKRIRNIWFGKIFLFQPAAISLSLDKRFDCIIYLGTMYHISTWISAVLAKFTGKRVLMWTHGYLKTERHLKGWIRERFYRLADGLLLYGNRSRELLLARGFEAKNLYVVYNSLNYEEQVKIRANNSKKELLQLRQKLFYSPELPTIIFIGRLTPQKNITLLCEAVCRLKADGFELNVLLVGDGPARTGLENSARYYEIEEHVVFYGACYREDELGPLIMLADICVSPGEIGLTCIHAMTYGTPTITHDNPDLQGPEWEAINPGITGDFFIHGDVVDLARVIKKWLDRDICREQIAKECQEIIGLYYNAAYQTKIINGAVLKVGAIDIAPTPVSGAVRIGE